MAVANGLANAKKILDEVHTGRRQYDFVEVMACPGGCIGGGGQPRSKARGEGRLAGGWVGGWVGWLAGCLGRRAFSPLVGWVAWRLQCPEGRAAQPAWEMSSKWAAALCLAALYLQRGVHLRGGLAFLGRQHHIMQAPSMGVATPAERVSDSGPEMMFQQ